MPVSPTTAALACLVSWLIGALYGGYRYERLWKDRTVRQVVRDYRAQHREGR